MPAEYLILETSCSRAVNAEEEIVAREHNQDADCEVATSTYFPVRTMKEREISIDCV